jgi:formiminoglutamate deiminase
VTSRYHCEFAWVDAAVAADILIEIDGGRITSVSRNAGKVADAVQLGGLVLPGFANAHSHAFQRALRGRTQNKRGNFWSWRDSMYTLAARLTPENYFELARATFAEMILSGVTCVGEFHYVHHDPSGRPYANANAMGEAVVSAAREAGLRITLLDTCYLQGGIGTAPDGTQRRFSDGNAAAWSARADRLRELESSDVIVGAAVHSVRAADPESIARVVQWAGDSGAPLHAHVSEQPGENEACIKAFGRTPTQLLFDRGALSDHFTAVHATHVTDTDIRLLGDNGCTVCFCPTTERDLADGIGPSPELESAGVKLALGSDSQAIIDPIEEMRALEMNTRLRTMERGSHSIASLISAATANGHRALGWHDGGRIAPGALADFIAVDIKSLRTAGASANPEILADAVVFASVASDVHHVVAAGRTVVRDGKHLSIDVANELAKSIAGVV